MMPSKLGAPACSLLVVLAGCGSSYGSGSHSSSGPSGGSRYGSSSSLVTSRPTQSNKAQVATIEASGRYAFQPNTITIKAGTTVAWSNKSNAPHTVTSDRSGVFDKNLSPGKTVSITFRHPGTYAYHCTFHPYMHGKVIVKR